MKFKKKYLFGIGIGISIIILDFIYFWMKKWFIPVLIIAVTVSWFQFWVDFFLENQRQKEIEARFLDFVRNFFSIFYVQISKIC